MPQSQRPVTLEIETYHTVHHTHQAKIKFQYGYHSHATTYQATARMETFHESCCNGQVNRASFGCIVELKDWCSQDKNRHTRTTDARSRCVPRSNVDTGYIT
jgi:hypothetical protein